MGLNLRRRTKRRLPTRLRQALAAPAILNGTWALDFMTDALYGGRKFRTLNVLDEGNREALAIDVAISIPSVRVIRLMEELVEVYGKPSSLRVDNGPELTAEAFVEWCRAQQIEIRYIQPGKPAQNAYIERFNRTYREEVLDAYLFESIQEVQTLTDEWIKDYNTERPHDSLGRRSPIEFLPRLQPPREYCYQLST
jgi:putative transposase